MGEVVKILITNYGIFGVITVILCGYILKIQGTHAKERSEWNQKHQENFETMLEVTNKNTDANTSLKNLIEMFLRTKGDS